MPVTQLIPHINKACAPFSRWLLQDKHKAKARHLYGEMEKAFTEHPGETDETYLEHLRFTLKMSGRFLYTSAVITLHGLLPFFCTRTASAEIERIYRIMKTRIPQKRREEIDRETRRPPIAYCGNGEAHVAIIGGGFSGALVLANLVRQAQGNLSIEWFAPEDRPGTGMAYGTSNPAHLLNVRAGKMGAFPSKPEGFYQWLRTRDGQTQTEAIWPGHNISEQDFVPRALYGVYLEQIVSDSLSLAKAKNINIHRNRSMITAMSLCDAATQQMTLCVERGGLQQEILADAVVLATGNPPPRRFGFEAGMIAQSRYIENVWDTPPDSPFPSHMQEFPADSEVVIIGTGLTMVDTVLTLKSSGYKGTVTAISRNGMLPLAHAEGTSYPAWEWVLAPHIAPRTALGLLQRLREEIVRAERQGYGWRDVLDSIRPVTRTLWRQLDIYEKRKFMSKLFTLWNNHRHRMAPELFSEIRTMQQSGTLRIVAGKIYYAGADKDGLTVAYRKRGANRIETLRPALVINCTGPDYDIASGDNALLKHMRDQGFITIGPLRIGVETTEYGSAKGKAPEALFAIGGLLVGELLESTAVPELREQAYDVSQKILHRINQLYDRDYHSTLVMGEAI